MNGKLHCPNYTSQIFDPRQFQDLVNNMSRKILQLQVKLKLNCIAATGNSGLLLAGAVGFQTKLPFFAVRKKSDSSHDPKMVNGFIPKLGARYLIIDDLIDTGLTIRRIVRRMQDSVSRSEPVGILLYNDYMDGKFRYPQRGIEIPIFPLTDY